MTTLTVAIVLANSFTSADALRAAGAPSAPLFVAATSIKIANVISPREAFTVPPKRWTPKAGAK